MSLKDISHLVVLDCVLYAVLLLKDFAIFVVPHFKSQSNILVERWRDLSL